MDYFNIFNSNTTILYQGCGKNERKTNSHESGNKRNKQMYEFG